MCKILRVRPFVFPLFTSNILSVPPACLTGLGSGMYSFYTTEKFSDAFKGSDVLSLRIITSILTLYHQPLILMYVLVPATSTHLKAKSENGPGVKVFLFTASFQLSASEGAASKYQYTSGITFLLSSFRHLCQSDI